MMDHTTCKYIKKKYISFQITSYQVLLAPRKIWTAQQLASLNSNPLRGIVGFRDGKRMLPFSSTRSIEIPDR